MNWWTTKKPFTLDMTPKESKEGDEEMEDEFGENQMSKKREKSYVAPDEASNLSMNDAQASDRNDDIPLENSMRSKSNLHLSNKKSFKKSQHLSNSGKRDNSHNGRLRSVLSVAERIELMKKQSASAFGGQHKNDLPSMRAQILRTKLLKKVQETLDDIKRDREKKGLTLQKLRQEGAPEVSVTLTEKDSSADDTHQQINE